MKFNTLLTTFDQLCKGIDHNTSFLENESDYEKRKEITLLLVGFAGVSLMSGGIGMLLSGLSLFGTPLIMRSRKLTTTLLKSKTQSFVQKALHLPTYLLSNNLNENMFRQIDSKHMTDTVAINIYDMTNNEGWYKLSLSDIPLLGLLDKWKKNMKNEHIVNENFNLFLTEREIQRKLFAVENAVITKHKPVIFISKQDNEMSVYVKNQITLNTEKEKIDFFYHIEKCLSEMNKKLKEHAEYIASYDECKETSELIENSKILESAVQSDCNTFSVLTPCKEGRLTQLLTQLDVSQLSESDIKSLNVIIAEINDKMNSQNNTEDYVELREQFKVAINQMIKYYQQEDNNRQLKEQIFYLKERMHAKNSTHTYHKLTNKKYMLK